jgi:hypothetical protein
MKLRTQLLLTLPRITLCVAFATLIGAGIAHPAHAQLTEPTGSNVITLPETIILEDPPNRPGLKANADGSIPLTAGKVFKEGETVYYRGEDYTVKLTGSQCTVGKPDYELRPVNQYTGPFNQYTGPVCRPSTAEEIADNGERLKKMEREREEFLEWMYHKEEPHTHEEREIEIVPGPGTLSGPRMLPR